MTRRATVVGGTGGRREVNGMVAGTGEPSAKRAKVDETEEDPLVRRREELILGVANARAEGKELVREAEVKAEQLERSVAQDLRKACAVLQAKNEKLLRRLPPDLWKKIVDEYLDQNDLLALAMTCRFFRDTTKDCGKKMVTNLKKNCLLELLKSGKMASHTLGWFQWVCDTFEIMPGFTRYDVRVKGAVYEGDLLNYALFQGSVEILGWLMEEKGFELNDKTDWWAGMSGSIEVFEHLSLRGYKFTKAACEGTASGGHLEALKYLRGLDPPCPWDEEVCAGAAFKGHLDVLKWARAQEPPCPWDWETCAEAAEQGHLEVLKWARSQDPPCPWSDEDCTFAVLGGQLEVLKWLRAQDPPCRWLRSYCRETASQHGHQHIVDWIDQREDESDLEPFDSDSDRSYDSYSDEHF